MCVFDSWIWQVLHELDICRGALYAQPERFFNMCMQAEMLLRHWEYAAGLIDLSVGIKIIIGDLFLVS